MSACDAIKVLAMLIVNVCELGKLSKADLVSYLKAGNIIGTINNNNNNNNSISTKAWAELTTSIPHAYCSSNQESCVFGSVLRKEILG